MSYIVFDLEWNQSSTGTDAVEHLPFEIIEIGAVKCNSRMEQIGQFHELIKPQVYQEMHRVTSQLLGLDMKELESCGTFREVMERFLTWCRSNGEVAVEDPTAQKEPAGKVAVGSACNQDRISACDQDKIIFCTWGTQDLTELQRNMKYYGMEPLAGGPIPFFDVQKLFSIAYEDRKTRRALEFAVDFLHIDKDIPFHRAYSDAYYTAKVLARCSAPKILENVSYDVYTPPVKREHEVKVQFDTYVKYISRQFADREEAFRDKEVVSSKCYLCHRNLRKKIKWFTNNGKHYYCVAYCEQHGYLKGKIRVRKTDDDMTYIVKTTKLITEKEAEAIAQRKEHGKEVRRRHRAAAREAKRAQEQRNKEI